MTDEARENVMFDVFLSHNSQDKSGVRQLAGRGVPRQATCSSSFARGGHESGY
jgi:hypothetical protein